MSQLSQFPSSPPMSDDNSASFRQSLRAVMWGAAAMVGGSLAMTTLIGVAAVTGMLVARNSAENIIAQLPASLSLAIFCAAGGWWMNVLGGYIAASLAKRFPLRHALCAGALAVPLNVLLSAIFGDSGPAWLTALATALIIPGALLGGWFAAPVPTPVVAPAHER
jgi:hypothetical protein